MVDALYTAVVRGDITPQMVEWIAIHRIVTVVSTSACIICFGAFITAMVITWLKTRGE